MELAEHIYADDPRVGHPDVRTRLADTDYFFLGNGHIQAAVQICRSGEGSPVGLLIMHPDEFGPKRAALTCDPETGVAATMVEVQVGDSRHTIDPATVRASWSDDGGVPVVRVPYEAGPAAVVERFFCPDDGPRVARHIEIRVPGEATHAVELQVGLASPESRTVALTAEGCGEAVLIHEIKRTVAGPVVETRWGPEVRIDGRVRRCWDGLTKCCTHDAGLDRLFSASRAQMPAAVDHRGRMDGSIWQYNLEWVRDQAHVAEALVRLGEHRKSRTILARLLDRFVSADGDTVDSGRRRPAVDVELDQNGELLSALGTYTDWTGDLELAESRWDKVRALAFFPFRESFLHRVSGLLHNRREYWERHSGFGIDDGFELMSQFFVALGLEQAARLADLLGHMDDGAQWRRNAARLRHAMLEDPRYRLIENGHFIKRRGTDGTWQREIRMAERGALPDAIPMLQEGPHLLDPDTSSVLPIAHEFVDARGALAARTLDHVEELWNQGWETGGYARYNITSEADSPGAWPFASLFVARACVEAGRDEKVWRILRWLATTPGGVSGAWFENDGPRIAPPYAQLGFTPWTWAELITLYVHHLLGVRPDNDGITVRPRLLAGLDRLEGALLVRQHRLEVRVRRAGAADKPGGVVNGQRLPWRDNGIRLPLPGEDSLVEVLC